MGWRGTIILALLSAAVGAYLWVEKVPPQEHGRPPTLLGEPRVVEPERQVRHVLDYDPADVVAVRLERDGHAREAKRSNGRWQGSTKPGTVSDFLTSVAQLTIILDIPDGTKQLTDYGLQPPQDVLHLQLRNRAAPLVLQIGDRNPAVTGVYVRIGENGPVALAGALLLWEFEKAFDALSEAGQPTRRSLNPTRVISGSPLARAVPPYCRPGLAPTTAHRQSQACRHQRLATRGEWCQDLPLRRRSGVESGRCLRPPAGHTG